MKDGFIDQLEKHDISFDEQDGAFFITLSPKNSAQYIEIAQEYIRSGYWTEVVGTAWLFIFEDGIVKWESVDTDAAILEQCKGLEPGVEKFRSVMEMINSREFYQGVLFHHEYGKMINSGRYTNTPGDVAVQNVIAYLEEKGTGKGAVNYRLRDWLISRQRYWGAPIPMIWCAECGWNPVPDEDLPVVLPDDIEWRPTGESPLKFHPTWSKAICPECGEPARRETDTMDTFMCSSWYHLRYLSPQYDQGLFDPEEYDYWMPVDTYTGGIEHATMHLIYTRFFHKAGRDMGLMQGPEPMSQLRNQGMVLGEDGEKMSKSRGNVVAPDELVDEYGADTIRAYLMFFARWDLGGPWDSQGVGGPSRWLKRVWTLFTENYEEQQPSPGIERELRRKVHQTLKNISEDFEKFQFNTIVSSLMELLNFMYHARERGAYGTAVWEEAKDIYLRMMAPVTPHIAEELWVEVCGKTYSIHIMPWPEVDEAATIEDMITLPVQVNGKLRDRVEVPVEVSEEDAKSAALNTAGVRKFIDGKDIRKVIYIPGRLVNIVV
jgi:leucyl-tRNA synthetase